jgi:hypothetical protein
LTVASDEARFASRVAALCVFFDSLPVELPVPVPVAAGVEVVGVVVVGVVVVGVVVVGVVVVGVVVVGVVVVGVVVVGVVVVGVVAVAGVALDRAELSSDAAVCAVALEDWTEAALAVAPIPPWDDVLSPSFSSSAARLASADCRLALACSRVTSASCGSSVARSWPLATCWPSLT